MPCLPHDPSILIEEDTIAELVAEFSDRLRRSQRLRPLFDRLVGNRWLDFEEQIAAFWTRVLLQDPTDPRQVDEALHAVAGLGADDIAALAAIWLESCLAVFPFHAAASVTELAERIERVIQTALESARTAGDGGIAAFEAAKTTLKAGAIYR
jgi:truncated hemoglobin YjbI